VAASEPSHLFVYGTLRRGAPMHALLERDVAFVAQARIRGRLYDLGAFPGLGEGGSGDFVSGELYRISAKDPARLLDALDRYEGKSFRRVIREVRAESSAPVRAWVYLFSGSLRGRQRIESGDYLNREAKEARRA
jgi:gamma-glutamylcyclotransferase (GGCT)/AIG2-like uncharacterized protein YtfP